MIARNFKLKNVLVAAGLIALSSSLHSLQAQAADLKHGEEVFKKATCAQCHPGGGNILVPTAQLKGEKFQRQYKDDASIITVIRNGITATPMPKFSTNRLPDADLPDLIAYIRSLSPQTKTPASKPVVRQKTAPKTK